MRGTRFALLLVCGVCLGYMGPARAEKSQAQVAADEQALQAANLKTDGKSLLKFFQQRTVTENDREKVAALIQQLGADSFKAREQATGELIARGQVAVEQLKEAVRTGDLEVVRRAERCLQRIREKDYPLHVPTAAARLLRQRKPAGAVKVLLAYLPYADNDNVADEVRSSLAALAVRDQQPDKALVAALTAKSPLLRAAAGEALTRAGVAEHKAAVRKLLFDPDVTVRLRVAMSLVLAKDRDGVPALIQLLPELSQAHAWRAEDLLVRLAEGNSPPAVSLGADEAGRRKARDAWATWWKEHGDRVNLARLHETPQLLGYTVIVLLDRGKVLELGTDDKVRWEINNLVFPLDVQPLLGDRVLVAEYHAARITERDHKGEVLWQKRVTGPLMAQRLPNGNTFIATDSQLLEVDRTDKEVFSYATAGGERIMKALKLPNGEVVCLTTDPRVVRLDATGKELHSFPVPLQTRLFGGRLHVLPTGRVLIPHHGENKVVEYDANGKVVWEVTIDQPIAAMRLPNGNTLVTTMTQNRAVEFDRNGNEVWQYQSDTRVTRAVRR